jgi:hypothetical protein
MIEIQRVNQNSSAHAYAFANTLMHTTLQLLI